MATLKRILLWIAAIIFGAGILLLLLALWGGAGSDVYYVIAVCVVALFFIIRALRKIKAGKTSADKAQHLNRPEPEKRTTVTTETIIEEKPDPQPDPQAKKSWIDSLPETEWERRKKRIAENRKNGIACCPKCGSTSLSVNKKGYSFVKGVLISPLGGTIGMNKLKVTCLNCGHTFKPGH